MRKLLVFAASLILLAPAKAAAAGTCDAPIYHQFDFWLGQWTVTNRAGEIVGTDSVYKGLNGCVVFERYKDAGDPGVGFGMSAVQPGNRRWHQTFMDDGGVVVTLDGSFANGVMELRGVNYPSTGELMSDGVWVRHGKVVEEIWKVSTDGGKTWKVRFDGFFHRTHSAAAAAFG